jgi:transposase-like protein
VGTNVVKLADRMTNEADAYRFIEELRWGDGEPVCPHCDNLGASYIEPRNGVSRATRTGAQSQRRVWRCLACRKQFSVLTGTVFHGTKISLRIWVLVIFEMVASKNGVSASEIERKYGVCPRTAWHLLHRIREAMKGDALVEMMRGAIVADETFVGGKAKNRHKGQRLSRHDGIVPMVPGDHRSQYANKTAVLSLIDRGTGRSYSRVIPDITGATLRKAIAEQVDMSATTLYTDEAAAYRTFEAEFAAHKTVNHSEDEYVRYEPDGIVTSNDAENFFSQLKRSLDGTHHHVSAEHLPRYLAEFDFRYSSRKMTDTARMGKLMGQTGGRRLTYKRVTA